MDFSDRDVDDYGGIQYEEVDLPSVHQAAAQGAIPALIEAIWQDPSMLELQNEEGLSPLGTATQAQQLIAIKQLVKMGANINAQDKLGRTSLSIAAYQGWHDGVVYLLRHGAKHQIVDKSGRTPLHASTYEKSTSTMTVLLQTLTQEELNKPDIELMTALHWAAFHNRPQHMELLVQKGADIFVQDIDGKTPLHWASQNGCTECCVKLASHSDGLLLINSVDLSGKTPIHFAAAAGHVDVIKALHVYPGCDLEPEDPDDRTPLHWAAAMGMIHCLNLLLSLDVKPNPVDAEGGTPLDYTRQSGHIECQRLLEQKLGYETKHGEQETDGQNKSQLTSSTRNKRGPLSFIKDLFVPRKANCEIELSNRPCNSNARRRDLKDKNGTKVENKNQKVDDQTKHNSNSNVRELPLVRVSGEKQCNSLDSTPDLKRHQFKKTLLKRMSDGNFYSNKTVGVLMSKSPSYHQEVDVYLAPRQPSPEVSPRSLSLQPLPDINTSRSISPPSVNQTSESPTELIFGEMDDEPNTPRLPSSRKEKLAPLKGVKPLQGRGLLPHERISAIMKEESGPRSPTPPAEGDQRFSNYSLLRSGGDLFQERRHSYHNDKLPPSKLSARNKRNCSSSCAQSSDFMQALPRSDSPFSRTHSRQHKKVLTNISNSCESQDEVDEDEQESLHTGLSLPERRNLNRKIHSVLN